MKGSGMGLCAPLEAARINVAGDGYDWRQLGGSAALEGLL